MKTLIFVLLLLGGASSHGESVDWGICKADLENTGCLKKHDDDEKHECLEKKGKTSVSDECWKHNQKLGDKGKHKHDKKHSH